MMMIASAPRLLQIAIALSFLSLVSPAEAKEQCQLTAGDTTTPSSRAGSRPAELFEIQRNAFPKEAQFVLLGDSIAARWKPQWYPAAMKDQKVLNLGLGGDRTENVIWRLENLPLDKIKPTSVFIIIGTNNLRYGDDPCEIFAGIETIVAKVKTAWPEAKVMVSEILPRGKNFEYRNGARKELNKMIVGGQERNGYVAVLADETALTSNADSSDPTYRSDRLHLLGPGYAILGNALASTKSK